MASCGAARKRRPLGGRAPRKALAEWPEVGCPSWSDGAPAARPCRRPSSWTAQHRLPPADMGARTCTCCAGFSLGGNASGRCHVLHASSPNSVKSGPVGVLLGRRASRRKRREGDCRVEPRGSEPQQGCRGSSHRINRGATAGDEERARGPDRSALGGSTPSWRGSSSRRPSP